MRVAFGAAGAAGIWRRDLYLTEGGGGILLYLGCVVAFVLGARWVVETLVLMASPVRRFKATRPLVEELAGKFDKCAEGGDRRRFLKAVRRMHRLANPLATVRVYINVVETWSDDPEVIAGAARENRDELLASAPMVAEGALGEAQEARPR